MCGIAGCIALDGCDAEEVVSGMVPLLAHRGPDGFGFWSDGNVAIGHRRLSIIDPSTGAQPMTNEDGTVAITYNGELYNFRELKGELLGKGHIFRTSSDTEVIVHAYEEWGATCVERFRGMFAFAVVDSRRRRLFLARDQLGIKPLVYYRSSGRFAFASEIGALKVAADETLDMDLRSIDSYLRLQYIPAPDSIYRQIKKLLPGYRMMVSFDGEASEPEEYWRLRFLPVHGKGEDDWVDEVDAALRESVKAHLVSDVPFGAFLSGGVDSSIVVAQMARLMERPVETFTIGFEEEGYSELPHSEESSRRWGTNHHTEIVRPDALEILPDLVRHYGEPFGDSSAIPTYYLCRMARRHVPMVLSGDGGDELFAGYSTYAGWMSFLEDRHRKPIWKDLLYPLAVRIFPERYPPRFPHGPSLDNWLRMNTLFSTPLRKSLWRSEHRNALVERLDLFESEFARAAGFSDLSRARYLDMKSYLPFDILTKVDVASMMNSLEVRTPIVDVRIAELAAQVPDRHNMAPVDGVWTGKRLLKKVMERYYPVEFVHRDKKGFAVPVQKWFAPGGELHGEIISRLTGKGARVNEYFNPAMVRRVIDKNSFGNVWQLLFLEEWLRLGV